MCLTPYQINGLEVSCRECNDCCNTYKNTWVSRCCAELETHPHALCFTLTYADLLDDNGDKVPPLGAKVFRYSDVQKLWKRIRKAGHDLYGKDFVLRYVVVGEKGTRRGRCHYHGVMFSNHPIKNIGVITNKKGQVVFKFKKRLNWTTWGHGFVEFQPATREGISYALKYILKARMTDKRSRGTHREGKTEWLASSYLWCSKVPAIGADWLFNKLERLYLKGQCPVSLRITVPSGGDWYVGGELQKRLCLFVRDANNEFIERTGASLSGFKSLLLSVSEPLENLETGEKTPRKAKEWLEHGEIDETQEQREQLDEASREGAIDWIKFQSELVVRRNASLYSTRARKCFGVEACSSCKDFLSAQQIANDAQCSALWRESFERERNPLEDGNTTFDDWIVKQGLVAQGCQEKQQSKYSFELQSSDHQRYNAEFDALQRASNG